MTSTALTPPALSGYSLPLTPAGTASLIPPPPWHFSGDVIWVSYRADPAQAAAFLPPGLDLVDADTNAAVGFYDWQWCSDNGAELTTPGHAQFRECLITIAARLGSEEVGRVPVAWVDAHIPLLRGWLQGMPKVPGSIAMSRSIGVGRASSHFGAGGQYFATAATGGYPLITAAVDLIRPGDPPPLALQPLIHTRHDPGWGEDLPARTDLVRSTVSDWSTGPVWTGAATLTFHQATLGEFGALAPESVGEGAVFTYAETLAPGGLVHIDSEG